MKYLWYGSPSIRNQLCPGDKAVRADDDISLKECAGIASIIIEASDEPLYSRHTGLRWLQSFRRRTLSPLPALVFSFEERDALSAEFSMLMPEVPGIRFLRAPFTHQEFESEMYNLIPLTQNQLQHILRWHSGLQGEWKDYAHDLGNALATWPSGWERVDSILKEWTDSVERFAQDAIPLMEELRLSLDEPIESIRKTLQRVDRSLRAGLPNQKRGKGKESRFLAQVKNDLPPARSHRPPFGFDLIGIADDQGYEPATIEHLRQWGYVVRGPALDLEQARQLIGKGRPRVLLADLNFPSPEDGSELLQMGLASSSVQLIIAVSHADVDDDELPEGVENCCGALDFQNAERIHRIIWRRARERGVTRSA